jgi:hypothetical protein
MEVSATDILGMHQMDIDMYKNYVQESLFYIDHHDVLRSQPAGYPIAVTNAQLDALIVHLSGLRGLLKDK